MNPTSAEPSAVSEDEMRVAPGSRRMIAWLIDTVLEAAILAVSAVAGYILSWIWLGTTGDHGIAIFAYTVIGAVLIVIGVMSLWSIALFVIVVRSGQTPGQKATKVRVVNRLGAKLSLGRALARFMLGRCSIVVLGATLFVGDSSVVVLTWTVVLAVLYAPILFDGANRGSADWLVGSYVVPVRDADA